MLRRALKATLLLSITLALAACDERIKITLDGFGFSDLGVPDLKVAGDDYTDSVSPHDLPAADKYMLDGQPLDAPPADKNLKDLGKEPDLQNKDMPTGDNTISAKACGPAPALFSGSLCGPSAKPCKVLINEKLPTTAGFRNRQPALALDPTATPRVLFSLAVGNYTGYWGERNSAGKWTVTKTPFALAMGGVALEPSGSFLALAHKGDTTGGQLWRKDHKGWLKVQDVNPSLAGYAKGISGWPMGLAVDSAGCAHLGIYDLSQSEAYLRRNSKGVWLSQQLLKASAGTHMSLALAPSGLPHVAHWISSGSAGWQVHWYVPGTGLHQVAHQLGPWSLNIQPIGLKVVGTGVGTPHMLVARYVNKVNELTHTWRAAGVWKSAVVETDGGHSCGACSQGAQCTYDYSTYAPMAVVGTGSGDMRLLYSRTRYHGTKVGKQATYPPFSCTWTGGQTTGYIKMAWPSGTTYSKTTLVSGQIVAASGTVEAELDSKGNIHAAIYSSPTHSSNTDVRYLKIGK